MKLPVTLFTLFLAFTSAHARIGETEAEISKRYGEPTEKKPGYSERHRIAAYGHGDLTIVVDFLDGKSHRETFKRDDKQAMTEAQIDSLLQANQFTLKWQSRTICTRLHRFADWTLGNLLYALYDCDHDLLFVETVQIQTYDKQAKPASEKNKLKGF